jgi:hypothetical protein
MVFRNFTVSGRPVIAMIVFILLSAWGLAASLPKQQSAIGVSLRPAECETQARNFVKDRLQFWQRRLNLQKWTIRIDLVRSTSLKPKTLGNIHWDADTMKAEIEVQSSYDYDLPLQEMLDDMEFTVVHELVHLQLSSLPRSEASRSAEEHAVNELTRAFLKLAKPSGQPPPSMTAVK